MGGLQGSCGVSREILLSPVKEHTLDGMVPSSTSPACLPAAPGLLHRDGPDGRLRIRRARTVWNDQRKIITSAPGMPMGLSFVGDRWTERDLIGYAYAYEQVSKKRKTLKPYIRIDADLDSILKTTEV